MDSTSQRSVHTRTKDEERREREREQLMQRRTMRPPVRITYTALFFLFSFSLLDFRDFCVLTIKQSSPAEAMHHRTHTHTAERERDRQTEIKGEKNIKRLSVYTRTLQFSFFWLIITWRDMGGGAALKAHNEVEREG